jgi:hypothetical protein
MFIFSNNDKKIADFLAAVLSIYNFSPYDPFEMFFDNSLSLRKKELSLFFLSKLRAGDFVNNRIPCSCRTKYRSNGRG